MSDQLSSSEKTVERGSIERAVSMPLSIPEQANERLLSLLFNMAIEGDLRAAKLYLDYSLRTNFAQNTGLTLEEAIKLLKDHDSNDEL